MRCLIGWWGLIVLVLSNLVVLSRPRFWLYLAGPFALGAAASGAVFWVDPVFWLLFLFFLFPANVLLYGVNDFFDRDTDKFSSKKSGREFVFSGESWVLWSWVSCLVLGLLVAWWFSSWLVLGFLFLAVFYSAPPLRFKARLLLDSWSNGLYVLPGFFSYVLFSGSLPAWWVVVGAWSWAASMHLFSAIPDIVADKKAGLSTTAVVVGRADALRLCSVWWLLSLACAAFSASWFSLLFVVYAVFPLVLVGRSQAVVSEAYWYFPLFNGLVGFVLFWAFLL